MMGVRRGTQPGLSAERGVTPGKVGDESDEERPSSTKDYGFCRKVAETTDLSPSVRVFLASMARDRRDFLKVAGGAAGAVSLAGCIGGIGGGDDTTNVGMVYALGGLGDNSFNDMAKKGVDDAKSELGIEYDEVEPEDASQFQTLQRKYAQSNEPTYELICCIGFVQTDALTKTSGNFPDQNFMLVDSVVDADNVANYVFKEHEGSFQVGYLAGMLTTRDFSEGGGETNDDTVVGFVGGKQNPLIEKFEAGYIAGVHHANEDIEVKSAYAGSWSDIQRGKEIASSMYDDGADVVYHAAGGTGIGVFQAAEEAGRYAIGVDADQSQSASEYADWIVASMVKHVDTAVFESIETVVNDEFEGSTHALGLESGGVEAVIGTEYEGTLSDEVTSNLEDSKQGIVDGDISVPESLDEM
jgi:basic membrane protein A